MDEEKNNGQDIPVTSKKQMFIEAYKKRHPDASIDDEESLFAAINDGYGKDSDEYEAMKKREDTLVDMFTKDPRAAMMFTAMRDGEDLTMYLVKNFGDEFLDAINDPEKADDFAKAHEEWVKKAEKTRQMQKETDENLQKTLECFRAVMEKKGWTEEEAAQVFEACQKIIIDGLNGIVTPETIEMVSKGMRFDNAVRDAGTDGEIRGRNQKIQERLRKTTDDVPSLTGSGNQVGRNKKVYNPFLVQQ